MSHSRGRYGFTLVELLVVSALFLVFFSLVATAARPNANSQVRQLSQDLSSAILAGQTRAMTSEGGAGLLLVGDGVSVTGVLTTQSPPYITGAVTILSATRTSLSGSFAPTNASPADLTLGFRGRLLGGGVGCTLPVTPWLSFSSPDTMTLDSSLNQTAGNTVLPVATGTLGFLVERSGAAGLPALTLPRFASIDLRYSGVGMTATAPFATLSGASTVTLGFDRLGRLDMITQPGGSPAWLVPPAPLYLLVATVADITAGTSLKSSASRWIAIAPDTGRVTVAANVPGTFTGTPTQADLNFCRGNVRLGVTQGAR